nr:MAG TPA: tail assembly chaperone protein [Bacteriophage sp.]
MVPGIPCDLFGDGQQIRLTIGKFLAIEQMLKKPIGEIVALQKSLDLTSLTVMLSVGMETPEGKHQSKPPQWYASKIQELLMDGHGIDEISTLVIKAVAASGLLGHDAYLAVFPEAKTDDEIKKAEAEKN